MKRLADWIVAGVIALGFAVSVILLPRIPIYRAIVPWLLPATAAIAYLIIRGIARRSTPHHLQAPILIIATYVVIFVTGLHVLMVSNLAGVAWARALGPRAVVVLFGGVFVVAGNLLPRTRPNLAIGIRTQRMLADPQLWSRMHRLAGYAAVSLGCAITAAGIFLSGPAIGAVVGASAILTVTSLGVAYWRLTHA